MLINTPMAIVKETLYKMNCKRYKLKKKKIATISFTCFFIIFFPVKSHASLSITC